MFRVLSLSTALILAGGGSSFGANLLVNGDFETGAVAGVPVGQAYTPAPWTSTAPGNSIVNWDTWENTGTTGLPPTYVGLFTGATAPSGVRFAGGWDFEEMGQLLSTPLTPGQPYTVSALQRPCNPHPPSGFEIWLGTGPGSPVTMLGAFPMSAAGVWTPQSFNFNAPANSLSNPWFILKAYSTNANGQPQQVYVGIDDVFLDKVPTPGAGALAALAGVVLMGRRRR